MLLQIAYSSKGRPIVPFDLKLLSLAPRLSFRLSLVLSSRLSFVLSSLLSTRESRFERDDDKLLRFGIVISHVRASG